MIHFIEERNPSMISNKDKFDDKYQHDHFYQKVLVFSYHHFNLFA